MSGVELVDHLKSAGASLGASRYRHRTILFCIWLICVSFLTTHHVMWRDEVHAYSLAIRGNDFWHMLLGLRGEGHPALWFIILRAANTVFQTQLVLPATALIIGAAAMLLLVMRSPFRPIIIILILLGNFGLYEFVVMARNYGISMLILFAMASIYQRSKNQGYLLAILIFLLCNCNAHSVILAAGFLIFWFFDLMTDRGHDLLSVPRPFLTAVLTFLMGSAACYWAVYFPMHDAILTPEQAARNQALGGIIRDLLLPSIPLDPLFPAGFGIAEHFLFSTLIWLAVAGLIHKPGALLAALFVQCTMILLFHFVYPGGYRHVALYLVFLLTLYWLASSGSDGSEPDRSPGNGLLHSMGWVGMAALLAFQVPSGIRNAMQLAQNRVESSSAALGQLLINDELQDAIIIGDPDYHLEPLSYYIDNPTYLIRENRFGRAVRFSSKARFDLRLSDMLQHARRLRERYHRPVVIMLENSLNPDTRPVTWHKGYVWTLSTDAAEVREFLTATCLIGRFDQATSDENYDVYLLPFHQGEPGNEDGCSPVPNPA